MHKDNSRHWQESGFHSRFHKISPPFRSRLTRGQDNPETNVVQRGRREVGESGGPPERPRSCGPAGEDLFPSYYAFERAHAGLRQCTQQVPIGIVNVRCPSDRELV